MKAKFYLIAAAACAALAARSKNEVAPVDVDQEITFQAVVNKASTKAMIDGNLYATDAPSFGTAAYYNATGTVFPSSSSLYIPESEVNYNNTDKGWTTETPYYWPKNGALTFFSYSPWSINASTTIDETNGIVITNYNVDENQEKDVMVADVVTANSNDTEYQSTTYKKGVNTVFRHKLAQIVDVTFRTDKNYKLSPIAAGHKVFFINHVKLNNYKQTGTYTSTINVSSTNLGAWTDHSNPKSYIFYEETTPCGKEFVYDNTNAGTSAKSITNGYLLLLPQTFADLDTKFEIKYTIRTYSSNENYSDDVVTVEIPLYNIIASHKIEMNKKYTFKFTVGLDQIYWAPSVVAWDSETFDYTPTI